MIQNQMVTSGTLFSSARVRVPDVVCGAGVVDMAVIMKCCDERPFTARFALG